MRPAGGLRAELLIAPLSRYEPRVQQVDLRFTRSFRFSALKVNGNVDVANLFNTGNVLQTIGGRMIKFSTQIDF